MGVHVLVLCIRCGRVSVPAIPEWLLDACRYVVTSGLQSDKKGHFHFNGTRWTEGIATPHTHTHVIQDVGYSGTATRRPNKS